MHGLGNASIPGIEVKIKTLESESSPSRQLLPEYSFDPKSSTVARLRFSLSSHLGPLTTTTALLVLGRNERHALPRSKRLNFGVNHQLFLARGVFMLS